MKITELRSFFGLNQMGQAGRPFESKSICESASSIIAMRIGTTALALEISLRDSSAGSPENTMDRRGNMIRKPETSKVTKKDRERKC